MFECISKQMCTDPSEGEKHIYVSGIQSSHHTLQHNIRRNNCFLYVNYQQNDIFAVNLVDRKMMCLSMGKKSALRWHNFVLFLQKKRKKKRQPATMKICQWSEPLKNGLRKNVFSISFNLPYIFFFFFQFRL